MNSVQHELWQFLADDDGSALSEYGILAAALAIPMIAGLAAIVAAASSTLLTTGHGLTQIGTNP